MGAGGGASVDVCDLATTLPRTRAKAATSKRKRIDFICDSWSSRDVPVFAYIDRNTGGGEKAVKNRSTGVKFCQKGNEGKDAARVRIEELRVGVADAPWAGRPRVQP